MLKSNALADRLNAYSSGEQLINLNEEDRRMDPKIIKGSIIVLIGNHVASIAYIALKSIAFGYTLNLLLETNWQFWGFAAVGFSIEIALSKLHQMLKVFKRKKS